MRLTDSRVCLGAKLSSVTTWLRRAMTKGGGTLFIKRSQKIKLEDQKNLLCSTCIRLKLCACVYHERMKRQNHKEARQKSKRCANISFIDWEHWVSSKCLTLKFAFRHIWIMSSK